VGRFRALHTPGHNPGHTVYIHDDLETAFLGDLVRRIRGRLRPVPWIDTYDTSRARTSITRVGEETFAHGCTGHGQPLGPRADEALRTLAVEL